jgi:DNA (cytosine-5)-methyltransferase 1
MTSRRPRAVELFAGAGFFSRAFQHAGFQITRAVEIDPVAARTYAANVGNHVEVGDVSKINPDGYCEALIAGPPCQGFSTLNLRRGKDPRNMLSLQVIRWVVALQPAVVVVENVQAFLSSAVWATLDHRLKKLGYQVTTFVFDAVDFGAPQLRRRSFTFASRHGSSPNVNPSVQRIRTVREAFEGLSTIPDGRNNHYAPVPSPMALKRMSVIPPGGDKRDVMAVAPKLAAPSWWTVGCQVTDVWGRMEWDQPCNTLRTAFQNPSKGRYIHPEENRVISLREAARLHTIPDNWCFVGLPTQIARQIGNSVPPVLGDVVARMVLDLL